MTVHDHTPAPNHEQAVEPRRKKRKLLVGTALCSTFLLFQCTKPERDFDAIISGSGGRKGTGGRPEGGEGGDVGTGGAFSTGGRRSTGGDGGLGGDQNLGGTGEPSGGTGTGGEGTGGAPPPLCEDTSDPDCRCVDGFLIPKDVDGDGEGTRLCEASPGLDCDDGDDTFVANECGGCIKDLGGAVGDNCDECGVLKCQGDSALVCRSPDPQPKRCTDLNTPQSCVNGSWVVQPDCSGASPVCLGGACVQCNPGTPLSVSGARQYLCDTTSYAPDDLVYRCSDGGYWESSWIASCYASSAQVCDAATGSCKAAGIPHLRDRSFNVVPELLKGLQEKQLGRPVLEVFDSLLGSQFG